jgi:hypothetical protein
MDDEETIAFQCVWVSFDRMMYIRANMIRRALAICLAVILSCQPAIAARCACADCPESCGQGCVCADNLQDRDARSHFSKCSLVSCDSGSKGRDLPCRPCRCQCHKKPVSLVPPSATTGTRLTDWALTGDFLAGARPTASGKLSISAVPLIDTSGPRSALEFCILFCRFLA